MDSNNTETDIGDKCNLNGDCSPAEKKPFDVNSTQNIDDIATPSELKFDQGIVNNCDFLITVRVYNFLNYRSYLRCKIYNVL